MDNTRYGGSFAPPLNQAKLDEFETAIAGVEEPQLKDALEKLHTMVVEFIKTPASTLPGSPHPSGMGSIVPLEPDEIKRMDEHVPWEHELVGIQTLFDAIPETSPVRNMAFHLLWYAKELVKDREPITTDRL